MNRMSWACDRTYQADRAWQRSCHSWGSRRLVNHWPTAPVVTMSASRSASTIAARARRTRSSYSMRGKSCDSGTPGASIQPSNRPASSWYSIVSTSDPYPHFLGSQTSDKIAEQSAASNTPLALLMSSGRSSPCVRRRASCLAGHLHLESSRKSWTGGIHGRLDPTRPLSGKVALVTGGGRGIGRATAICFCRAGAAVVIGGRRQAHGQSVVEAIRAAGGKAIFVPCDVSVRTDVERLVTSATETFGGIDVLVNNAGISNEHPLAADPRGGVGSAHGHQPQGPLPCGRRRRTGNQAAGRRLDHQHLVRTRTCGVCQDPRSIQRARRRSSA